MELGKEKRPRLRLRREMTIRWPAEQHRTFTDAVLAAELVHNGVPQSAEAARVLLTSLALSHLPMRVRVAAAVHRNATQILYGLLARAPVDLRAVLRDIAERLVRLAPDDFRAFQSAEPAPRRRRSEVVRGDVRRLHLVLDSYLFDWLEQRLAVLGLTEDAPRGIREVLLDSLTAEHMEVLAEYARRAGRLRGTLKKIVDGEIQELASELSK